MLYYLFDLLEDQFDFPGAGVFQYISFRAGAAIIISLFISMFFGKMVINWLRKKQIGESVRDLGLAGQLEKQGTPTMGGVLIIGSVVIPVLLLGDLCNVYVQLLLFSIIWLGALGYMDDHIKVVKKNKEGLSGKFKIIGQIVLGAVVGLTLYFHEDVVVRQVIAGQVQEVKSTVTTIPFVKNNELDYKFFVSWISEDFTWAFYVLAVIFIITAVSNGANMTDGLDGLAAGTSSVIVMTLAVLSYVSGNVIFSEYLNIMYIPKSGEMVIFCAALVGACIGFLWYNSYPAQVFMGDTGSLALGGIIAVIALTVRKELMIPLLCGIFLVENLSVIIQVMYFKYTKKKYGTGRRVLKMAPLHHHYQKSGIHEAKIVVRFIVVGILLAVATLATLKLR